MIKQKVKATNIEFRNTSSEDWANILKTKQNEMNRKIDFIKPG